MSLAHLIYISRNGRNGRIGIGVGARVGGDCSQNNLLAFTRMKKMLLGQLESKSLKKIVFNGKMQVDLGKQ